jgi:hypothetical protein
MWDSVSANRLSLVWKWKLISPCETPAAFATSLSVVWVSPRRATVEIVASINCSRR